jgi:hypothetical protein
VTADVTHSLMVSGHSMSGLSTLKPVAAQGETRSLEMSGAASVDACSRRSAACRAASTPPGALVTAPQLRRGRTTNCSHYCTAEAATGGFGCCAPTSPVLRASPSPRFSSGERARLRRVDPWFATLVPTPECLTVLGPRLGVWRDQHLVPGLQASKPTVTVPPSSTTEPKPNGSTAVKTRMSKELATPATRCVVAFHSPVGTCIGISTLPTALVRVNQLRAA